MTRGEPIRPLVTILLIVLWTALVAVAALVGLSAWQQPKLAIASELPREAPVVEVEIDAPAALEPLTLAAASRPSDASTARDGRTLVVHVGLALQHADEPDSAPDREPRTGIEPADLRVAALAGEPSQVVAVATPVDGVATLEDVPPQIDRVALFAAGASPRYGYLDRASLPDGWHGTQSAIGLTVPHHRLQVALRFPPSHDDPKFRGAAWLPIIGRLSSVDDPGWAGVAPQIAYADLVTGEAAFDFGPLAAGSYRLEVDGFELADEAVLAVPGPPTPARFQGQLRAPRSGGVPPVKRATPGARSGPEPRRGSD